MSYYMSSWITSEYADHEMFEVVKHIAEALQMTSTWCYMGPHWALRCGILVRSLELRLPADFPVLRWVTTGPHELAITPTVLRHFYNQKDPQARIEQLKLSKIDLSTWHKQSTPSMQGIMGKALYYAKPMLRVSPYFQVLALFKSFWRRLHPTLLKQEL
jgi:hypothetical protein